MENRPELRVSANGQDGTCSVSVQKNLRNEDRTRERRGVHSVPLVLQREFRQPVIGTIQSSGSDPSVQPRFGAVIVRSGHFCADTLYRL